MVNVQLARSSTREKVISRGSQLARKSTREKVNSRESQLARKSPREEVNSRGSQLARKSVRETVNSRDGQLANVLHSRINSRVNSRDRPSAGLAYPYVTNLTAASFMHGDRRPSAAARPPIRNELNSSQFNTWRAAAYGRRSPTYT